MRRHIATLLTTLLLAGATSTALAQDHEPTKTNLPSTTTDAGQGVSDAVLTKKLTFMLSGYEYFPSRKDLDGLASADVVTAKLRTFADDTSMRPSLRLRAVDALGYYDDEATVAYLRALVDRPTETLPTDQQRVGNLVRHHAIVALAKAVGPDALDDLEPFLKGDDLQLRLTAINAIGKHGGKAGHTLLEKLLKNEDNPAALREIRKFVR